MLIGTWDVLCIQCRQVDEVSGATSSHKCTKCGAWPVAGDQARVFCRSCQNFDLVYGITEGHKCSHCGKNMRK